ncbi:MAG: class I SAM-dependent methyltransferase [Candidatus Omnitrophica bacterium]|nr:class I SAM-dependent methyltransferase [Candidatus Omnitrophota bacterium]
MREVNIKNDSELWDKVWKRVRSDFHEDKIVLHHEISSFCWRKIEKRILKNYRSFKVLDVIEIRVGRGENALLMGLKGANITILDYSEVALDKARLLFSHFNCKARFIKADVLPS